MEWKAIMSGKNLHHSDIYLEILLYDMTTEVSQIKQAYLYTVACRAVARQRKRDERIY
jgi:hypothetical protein